MPDDPRYMRFGYRLRITQHNGEVVEAPYAVVARTEHDYRITTRSIPLALIASVEILNRHDAVIDTELLG